MAKERLTKQVGAEWNPHRPDVPAEISDVSPRLYDYLRDQAETLRKQHNLTQAGDTTFPWEVLSLKSREAQYTPGSTGKFYHETYGLITAKYVQFSDMNDSIWPGSPVGWDIGEPEFAWRVTNKLAQSAPHLVVGICAATEMPANGEYGWAVAQGIATQKLQFSRAPLRLERFTWAADGVVSPISEVSGPPIGTVYLDSIMDDVWVEAGAVFIDTLGQKDQTDSGLDVANMLASMERVIRSRDYKIQFDLARTSTKYKVNYEGVQHALEVIAARVGEISFSGIRAEITETLQLTSNYRQQAGVAAYLAGTAQAGMQTTLTAVNEFRRQARTHADEAGFHAESSTILRNEATISRNEAGVSAQASATSAQSASASETAAGTSAQAALSHETNASTSANNAATQASNASTSAGQAGTSATQASQSATNAAASASQASSSATTATNASTSASNHATTAGNHAANAGTQANNASVSAGSASTSATQASQSASDAATNASTASSHATTATNAATSSTTQANNAAGSATNAANSAGTASTQASNASTSAGQASTSASNAAGSASTASTHASAASLSARYSGGAAATANTSPGAAPALWTRGWGDLFDASNNGSINDIPIVNGRLRIAQPDHTSIHLRLATPIKPNTHYRARITAQRMVDGADIGGWDGVVDHYIICFNSAGQYLGGFSLAPIPYGITVANGIVSATSTIGPSTSSEAIRFIPGTAFARVQISPRVQSGVLDLISSELVDNEGEFQANNSAQAAATQASNASTSASLAGQHANAAQTSATQASTSYTDANTAANSANTSANNAAGSATNAAGSANNAATQANNAATSASNASTSANQASTSASNAAQSAGSASTSASAASTSEFNAGQSANTSTSASTAASDSAIVANNSATTASGHATTASDQAGVASGHATTAIDQAGIATNQAGVATTQAGVATDQAGIAGGHATTATNKADAASTSATSAQTSADAAGASASSASTQANNASVSAGNASTSASQASTHATNASNHAASAQTNATISAGFGTGYINNNAIFSNWPDPNGLPVSFTQPAGRGNLSRVAGLANIGYAARFNITAVSDQSYLLVPYGTLIGSDGFYYGELDIYLASGTLRGCGIQFTNYNQGGMVVADRIFLLSAIKDINGIVHGNGTVGRFYRFRIPLRFIGDTHNIVIAVVANFPDARWENGALKDITFYRAGLRPASQSEAAVINDAGAVVNVGQRSMAWLEQQAVVGGATAGLALRVEQAGGVTGDAELAVARVLLRTTNGGVVTTAVELDGTDVVLRGNMSKGGGVRFGERKIPFALQAFNLLAADGENVSFGGDLTNIPDLTYTTEGLAPLASGQSYDIKFLNLTSTGYTQRAKIVSAGTTSSVTTANGVSATDAGPQFRTHKPVDQNASDGNYNYIINYTIELIEIAPGEGYAATASFDCFVRKASTGTWIQIGTIDRGHYSPEPLTESAQLKDVLYFADPISYDADYEFGISNAGQGIIGTFYVTYTGVGTASNESSATPSGQRVKVRVIPKNQ